MRQFNLAQLSHAAQNVRGSSRKVIRDPPSRRLARASKRAGRVEPEARSTRSIDKTFRLEPRAFSGEGNEAQKERVRPRYARSAYQHAQNAARTAISPSTMKTDSVVEQGGHTWQT